MRVRTFAPKISKTIAANMEKTLFLETLPTKRARCPEIFPADHVPLARSENFSGQKILV